MTKRLKDDPQVLDFYGAQISALARQDGHTIQIFRGAGYSTAVWKEGVEKRRFPKANLWLAYDRTAHEMGGVLIWGERDGNYQFVGDREPVIAALAYIAAAEAEAQRVISTRSEESYVDPQFPLQPGAVERARARLEYLESRFFKGNITAADSPYVRGVAMRKPKAQWWVANSEFTSCYVSGGPAEKLEEFVGFTDRPVTKDFRGPGGELVKVEVSIDRGDGYDRVWTYFRSEQQCLSEQVNYSQQLADKYQ
ncbi:hypothetical protein [Rhizorhabdus argentea]|uniref:hypothetical protein n=1 Tax=Rhizorhabdus argentea TaxID=1387174 RepID=UPI0030EB36D3